MKIKKVLIVLNTIDRIDSNISKAFEIAKLLNAGVELLYVHEEPIFDINRLLNQSEFNAKKVKEFLKSEVDKYSSKDIAIFVKVGDTASQVWDLARDDKESLIVTPYSELSSTIADKNGSLLYIIKNYDMPQKALLYTESLDNIENKLEFLKLFSSDVSLVYNFYYISYSDPIDPTLGAFSIDDGMLLETQIELFEKFKNSYNIDASMFVNSSLDGVSLQEFIDGKEFDLVAFCNIDEFDIFDNTSIKNRYDILKC